MGIWFGMGFFFTRERCPETLAINGFFGGWPFFFSFFLENHAPPNLTPNLKSGVRKKKFLKYGSPPLVFFP